MFSGLYLSNMIIGQLAPFLRTLTLGVIMESQWVSSVLPLTQMTKQEYFYLCDHLYSSPTPSFPLHRFIQMPPVTTNIYLCQWCWNQSHPNITGASQQHFPKNKLQLLGARGHLLSRFMVSLLWVLKQFTCPIPSGSMVSTFKKYLSIHSNFTHQAHGGYFWKVLTTVPSENNWNNSLYRHLQVTFKTFTPHKIKI